jgi:hypothetical protein
MIESTEHGGRRTNGHRQTQRLSWTGRNYHRIKICADSYQPKKAPTMSTSNDTTAAAAAAKSTPRLFMHVQYKVPGFTDDGGSSAEEHHTQKQAIVTTVTNQSFDASNCPAAIVGLHPSVEPVKPDPGDYSYSGMHDHGPLPPPTEGGQFAQIIGFVNAAKNASDAYLSDVIEKEKAHAPLVTSDSMKQHNKRKKIQ